MLKKMRKLNPFKPLFTCKKCSHQWQPKRNYMSKVCPKCQSPDWNRPKPKNNISKNKFKNNVPIRPMETPVQKRLFDSVFCKAGKFAVPLIFSLTGVEDSLLIGKAFVNSFEESLKEYETTKDVDEAVITGIKSFFKNYIVDKAETSTINNISPYKNDNIEFEAILNGTTSMSIVYAFMEIPDLYEI